MVLTSQQIEELVDWLHSIFKVGDQYARSGLARSPASIVNIKRAHGRLIDLALTLEHTNPEICSQILRAVALAYSALPGYREEWRP